MTQQSIAIGNEMSANLANTSWSASCLSSQGLVRLDSVPLK